MKVNRIVDLEVSEISLCGAPMNADKTGPLAVVTLFKSAVSKKQQNCRVCSQAVEAEDSYCRKCGAPFYKAAPAAEENRMDPKELEKAKNEAAEAIAKANKDAADAKAALEKAEKEKAELEAKAKASGSQVEALQKSVGDLTKLVQEQARVAKRGEVVARVSKLKSLPATADEVADILVAVEAVNPELAKIVEALLEKSAELAAKGLGQHSDSTSTGAKAEATRYKTLVDAKLAADPKMPKWKAEKLVFDENPDLYLALSRPDAQ